MLVSCPNAPLQTLYLLCSRSKDLYRLLLRSLEYFYHIEDEEMEGMSWQTFALPVQQLEEQLKDWKSKYRKQAQSIVPPDPTGKPFDSVAAVDSSTLLDAQKRPAYRATANCTRLSSVCEST